MRIPLALYRLQFQPAFGFDQARAAAPYLARLGVSDIYASPIFQARPGSRHGYDLVDPNQLNPELGPEETFQALTAETQRLGLGWVQDIVPNHMAFDSHNHYLMDVLENGRQSKFFNLFDINWDHPYESMHGRVLAPFLGNFYGEALENGEIKLEYGDQGLFLRYYDLRFPLKIESYVQVFASQLHQLRRELGKDHPDFVKIHGLLSIARNRGSGGEEDNQDRYDQIKFIKGILWELYSQNPVVREYLDGRIRTYNGSPGVPDSFNDLDRLLSEQWFRLSFWKVAAEEINYRRFFSINELISVRMEDDDVFERTHRWLFGAVSGGAFTGLRVDHVDGLQDPTRYLKRLRERAGDCYLVVEKILAPQESLHPAWPVAGTTGYDFLYFVNELFCQPANRRAFDKIYSLYEGVRTPLSERLNAKKRLIIGKHMAGDVDNLAHLTKTVFSQHRHAGDLTLYGLRRAIVEVLAQFPVYRTYIDGGGFREQDRAYVAQAIERSLLANPSLWYELKFLEKFLLLQFEDYLSEENRRQWVQYVMRFQQFTAPLMAKGFEDTFFYTYNRHIALNEVGGNPEQFGLEPRVFHDYAQRRLRHWPQAMNTTATHDTKRGEDMRARLNVLSEIPQEWDRQLKVWSRLNARKKGDVHGQKAPDRNDEYFLYQTLLGAWPFQEKDYPAFRDRIKAYVIKAVREAKVHTAWIKPDTEYENAYLVFLEKCLDDGGPNPFLRSLLPFQRKLAHYGCFNSLAQSLLKFTVPGVPDLYQGCELWDLNLVDPDNRRSVDYALRDAWLQDLQARERGDRAALLADLLRAKDDGRCKLYLTYQALQARRRLPSVFQTGDYQPLEAAGKFREHVFAFARTDGSSWLVAVLPRFLTGVIREDQDPVGQEIWADTRVALPAAAPAVWEDVFGGRELQAGDQIGLGQALQSFPVALLLGKH